MHLSDIFSSGLLQCLSPGLLLLPLTTSYQSSGDCLCYCDWKVLISSQTQGRVHTAKYNDILATLWESGRCTEQSDRSPYWLPLVLFLTCRAVHLLPQLRVWPTPGSGRPGSVSSPNRKSTSIGSRINFPPSWTFPFLWKEIPSSSTGVCSTLRPWHQMHTIVKFIMTGLFDLYHIMYDRNSSARWLRT